MKGRRIAKMHIQSFGIPGGAAPLRPHFSPAKTVVSLRAAAALRRAGQDAPFFVDRHLSGDPGDADASQLRKAAPGRLESRFRTLLGEELLVRTSEDRAVTAVLLALECEPSGFFSPPGDSNGLTWRIDR